MMADKWVQTHLPAIHIFENNLKLPEQHLCQRLTHVSHRLLTMWTNACYVTSVASLPQTVFVDDHQALVAQPLIRANDLEYRCE